MSNQCVNAGMYIYMCVCIYVCTHALCIFVRSLSRKVGMSKSTGFNSPGSHGKFWILRLVQGSRIQCKLPRKCAYLSSFNIAVVIQYIV